MELLLYLPYWEVQEQRAEGWEGIFTKLYLTDCMADQKFKIFKHKP